MMPEDYHRFTREQKRRFWQQHVEGWQQSGLSQRAYCRRHEQAEVTQYLWRHRQRRRRPASAPLLLCL